MVTGAVTPVTLAHSRSKVYARRVATWHAAVDRPRRNELCHTRLGDLVRRRAATLGLIIFSAYATGLAVLIGYKVAR